MATREPDRPLQRSGMARGRSASLPLSYTTSGDTTGRFKFGNYRITAAEQDEWGLAVWFDVPRLAFNHFV